jgi:hypothetical protein
MSRKFYSGLVALLIANLLFSLQAASPAQAQTTPQWQDTGRVIPNNVFCVDSGRKDRLIYAQYGSDNTPSRIGMYDLQNGQDTVLSTRKFSGVTCGSNGNIYLSEQLASGGSDTYLINTNAPGEKKIQYLPQLLAVDGSRYAYYSQTFDRIGGKKSQLLVSADNGLTWQERGQQFNGYIRSVTMAQSDGRVIYALVHGATPQADGKTALSVYISRNAGESWELRYQSAEVEDSSRGGLPYFLLPFSNYQTPADHVILVKSTGGFGSSNQRTLFVSTDGAKTFTEVGTNNIVNSVGIHYTTDGLLRYSTTTQSGTRITKLDFSSNGKDWSALSLPQEVTSGLNFAGFQSIATSPNTFLINRRDLRKMWISTNGGKNWQVISENLEYEVTLFTHYAPTTIFAWTADNRLYKLDLSQYDRVQTERARANNLSIDNIYFPETGHNLNGVFRRYWEANGGLAQFGYPKTEPFPEYNPADGKIYTVQYYERNRFEYHPELAGTKYEVLLGLLGNQMTEKQRAEGHGAFNRFPNMNYPGGTYFPETGHNLRNSFKAYWEQYGGLAIYGYPTSEEYEEVNPDDGKTYVVQYFERARFEYHPENKGTKYEVLLGLLGNALLRQKAWLS